MLGSRSTFVYAILRPSAITSLRFASAPARAASDTVPHIAPRRCVNEQQQQQQQQQQSINHHSLGVTSNCASSLLGRLLA
jgi:hypothetical protein